MIKRISASSRVNVICGASEASDTRKMVSGANACRRPSGTFSTPAATSTAGSTHGPSAVSTDLDVALRFVVDHERPDRALLRESRRGATWRRAAPRRQSFLVSSARSRRHLACALERFVVPEHFHGDGGGRLAFRGRHRHFKDSRRAWQHVPTGSFLRERGGGRSASAFD